ncbi:MAG: Stp1/IreP family PP2C-type Ser/Thr phosphatase [Eubacterium sp.]|nr:Stp1/IreP family PP2C-type Ser/Thr phosphatase [Eubacterium sp.]
MKSFSITDTGRMRDSNQDSVFCDENTVGVFPNLFLVADGMGGHNAGDLASRICIETFVERLKSSTMRTPVSAMEDAAEKANQAILDKSMEDEKFRGMGTTLVGMVIEENTAYIINIGDSRLYQIRGGIRQITVDHSLVEEMVLSGEIEKNEMRTHPNKNIITRALGTTKNPKPDCFELEVRKGDTYLLCSDGLSNMLDDREMEAIISCEGEELSEVGRKLVEAANEAGGKDNISAVLVRID